MIRIVQAASPAELNDVRALMRAFVVWHREAHPGDAARIDSYFDAAAFEASLAGLPGEFAPPAGALLLAHAEDGRPAGCVAMRAADEGVCEMKRMYVADAFRGQGVGKALVERLLVAARAAGHKRMGLETSVSQTAAIALYERMGFRRIEPYNAAPAALEGWLVALERGL